VSLRQAAYESPPADLEAVFAGIDILFLISYPSPEHAYRVKVQLPAVDAAHRAGVKHIFYSSLGFDGYDRGSSLAGVMQAHLETETHLQNIAAVDPMFTYTSIREGLYAESTPIYTSFFMPRDPASAPADEILIPHDGSGPGVSWVQRDELGEASARLIARYAADPKSLLYLNAKVTLTGPRVWSLVDTVAELAKVSGRKDLSIRQVSVDEYTKLPQVLAKFGTVEKARAWSTAWDAIREGEAALVTSTLEEILGRKPEEFNIALSKHWDS
jgi:uncharacterized protein YbjT (DUF2867 family)